MDDVSAGGLIYLVEDDPDVRVSFVWMLEAYGFRIEAFATPLAFLEATLSPEPHCVIMDLRLPELSGIETLERLRRRGDRAPVIIVTGHGDIKAADEARTRGRSTSWRSRSTTSSSWND